MRWYFWQKPVPQELSDQVRKTLTAQYHLDSHRLDELRVSSKNGRYSGRQVKYIRIFDPYLIEDGEAASLSYDDLEETNGQHKALLFEGHIEKDDIGGRVAKDRRVNLRDRRIPEPSILTTS